MEQPSDGGAGGPSCEPRRPCDACHARRRAPRGPGRPLGGALAARLQRHARRRAAPRTARASRLFPHHRARPCPLPVLKRFGRHRRLAARDALPDPLLRGRAARRADGHRRLVAPRDPRRSRRRRRLLACRPPVPSGRGGDQTPCGGAARTRGVAPTGECRRARVHPRVWAGGAGVCARPVPP